MGTCSSSASEQREPLPGSVFSPSAFLNEIQSKVKLDAPLHEPLPTVIVIGSRSNRQQAIAAATGLLDELVNIVLEYQQGLCRVLRKSELSLKMLEVAGIKVAQFSPEVPNTKWLHDDLAPFDASAKHNREVSMGITKTIATAPNSNLIVALNFEQSRLTVFDFGGGDLKAFPLPREYSSFERRESLFPSSVVGF